MENEIKIAEKWLNKNSEKVTAFQNLIEFLDDVNEVPDYHGLASKMLPLFVKDEQDVTSINLFT